MIKQHEIKYPVTYSIKSFFSSSHVGVQVIGQKIKLA